MTRDDNKGISQITYNHLNLPKEILFSGTPTRKILYLYDALGQKVQKKVINGLEITTMDYLGGFHYENTELKFFPTTEGYVNATKNGNQYNYNYVYNYTDHLGNIRLSYTYTDPILGRGNLRILEENHYYPFGLKHKKYGSVDYDFVELEDDEGYYVGIEIVPPGERKTYQYKYGGNELQDELNLNVYALGWRDYDPALGRFNKLDRFSEKYYDKTPYGYAGNNPVLVNDIQGDSLWISLGKNERVLYENGKLLAKGEDGSFSDYKGSQARLDKKGNVKGYKGILGETVKTLNKLQNGSDFANTLITTLQSSDNNFTIKSGYNTVSRVQVDLNSPDGRTGVLNNNAYAFQ